MRNSRAGRLLVLLVHALSCQTRPIVDPNSDETIVYKLLDAPLELPRGPFVLLHTLTGQCIQPLSTGSGNSTFREGVDLVLLSDGCNRGSQNTQFILTAAGHLQHVGTDTCVAPASDPKDSNPTAVLKACSNHGINISNWQWSVTGDASLQHRSSRKCLHPQGGTANPGVKLHLHVGCNEERLMFMPTAPSKVASSLSERKQPLSDAHLEISTGRRPSEVPAPLCCTSQDCVHRKGRRAKHTFLTTARSGAYVAAVEGLACSLAKSNPGSQLIVLAGSSDSKRLSAEQLDYLQKASIPGLTVKYKIVRDIDFPNYDNPRFHLNWIKLQAWNLTDWDAIIMIDADTVVVGDLKHLFYLPHHFATVPYQALRKFNYNAGGFMFLRPCWAVFEHMLSLLLDYPSLQFRSSWSEQGFLRWYFYYDVFNLPMQYHANAHEHSDLGTNGTVTGLVPILLHFSNRKPWEVPESDALYKYATPCNSSFPARPAFKCAAASGHHRCRRQPAQRRSDMYT